MCIILLSGYAGSGKDTCGQYLCEQYKFKRYAVANVMKNQVSKVFKIPLELLNSQDGKASTVVNPVTGTPTKVRDVIIDYAMGKRVIDQDYWINAMITAIRENGDDEYNIVVTDFRFPNELTRLVDAFPNQQVVTVRINRLTKPMVESQCSENVLDNFNFDHVIDNTGNMDNLRSQVDAILSKIQFLL